MSGDREETLRQFCDVTGADENRSKFFLESSNWQLEEAISSFYEHGGNVDEPPPSAPVALPPTMDSDSDMDSPPDSPQGKSKKEKTKTNTKFATLDSLQQDSSSDEEEAPCPTIHNMRIFPSHIVSQFAWIKKTMKVVLQEYFCDESTCSKKITKNNTKSQNDKNECDSECKDKEEIQRLKKEVERLLSENSSLRQAIAGFKKDETGAGCSGLSGQAFYAGGSERSGQQILGPSKGRKDIVSEVFKSVKERGAVVFEDEPAGSSRGRGGAFGGVGYRLGQTADDHEQVTPAGATTQQTEARSVRLRLYREGFTVDQSPLRSYTDPEHAEFLNYIRRGEIPPELAGGGEVRVSLEDRRHEECPRNVVKPAAFTGKGQMLGSPTPPVAGAPAPAASGPADRAAALRAAQDSLRVDDSQPLTTIQFRLADGSRITGRFNHSHTVADLHRYISRAEPSYQLQPFVLLTTFPSKELSDQDATLASANLLNTTLLQRLK